MISTLVLCSGCWRHFRSRDDACPFCGAAASKTVARAAVPLSPNASRSRRYAARAVILAASVSAGCSSDDSGGNGFGGKACEGSQNPTGYTLCESNASCTSPETCYGTIPTNTGCRPNIQPQQCGNGIMNCQPGFVCSPGICGSNTCVPACDPASCTGTSMCSNGLCVPKTCDMPGAAPCEPHTQCTPGAQGASAGCVPVHCSDTDPCEKNQDCVATAQGRGCVTRQCSTDATCDCGYCVNSQCQSTLGVCYQVIATPYGCVWPDEELV